MLPPSPLAGRSRGRLGRVRDEPRNNDPSASERSKIRRSRRSVRFKTRTGSSKYLFVGCVCVCVQIKADFRERGNYACYNVYMGYYCIRIVSRRPDKLQTGRVSSRRFSVFHLYIYIYITLKQSCTDFHFELKKLSLNFIQL